MAAPGMNYLAHSARNAAALEEEAKDCVVAYATTIAVMAEKETNKEAAAWDTELLTSAV